MTEKKQKTETNSNDAGDEEISIDLSKAKNFFTGLVKEENKEVGGKKRKEKIASSSKSESSFKIKDIPDFFNKHAVLFLILIPLILAIFLRVQTANLPITDTWANDAVIGNLKTQMKTQLETQYPNLPDQNINHMVDMQLAQAEGQNKALIDNQVKQTSNFLKSNFQDKNGLTYLITIDPYFWLRHAKNIVNNGNPGDNLKDGKPYDNYMLAPIGRSVPPDVLYAYTIAYSYKIMNIFTGWPIEKVAFFLPVVLSALCVIPAFFISKKFSGNVGGFFAALIVASHITFLSRSMGGISDTDVFNVFFPLMIAWLFIEGFEAKSLRKGITIFIIDGLLVGLYSFGWSGWWYMFDFVIAAMAAYIIYYFIANRDNIKKGFGNFLKETDTWKLFAYSAVFFISSMAFVSYFTGFPIFMEFANGPSSFMNLKLVATTTIWPNVFTTVAEQVSSTLSDVIKNIGGAFLFFMSVMGILLTTAAKNEGKTPKEKSKIAKRETWFFILSSLWILLSLLIFQNNEIYFIAAIFLPLLVKIIMPLISKEMIDIKFSVLMALWFGATVFASVKGVRYALLLVPAFALGFGIFAGIIYEKITKWISGELKAPAAATKIVVLISLLLFLAVPLTASYTFSRTMTGDLNDAWFNALSKIDAKASRNAIVSSWWDYGHWFKYISNRPVTFDGTSQSQTPVYWIGKVLLTNDEKQAVGILKMLDCGNYVGVREINNYIKDELKSKEIMDRIIMMNKSVARDELIGNGLIGQEADDVLQYTHCNPPEGYFITSDDMMTKSPVWAHFGSWDFRKAAMYNDILGKKKTDAMIILEQKYSMNQDEADQTYYDIESQNPNMWIAPSPTYLSKITPCLLINNNKTLNCQDLLYVNMTTHNASFVQNAGRVINSVVYADNATVHENIINPEGDISVALIPTQNGISSVFMTPSLAMSMYTRLFLYQGHGLKYFGEFDYEKSIFGNEIYVWKVDWEGKQNNVMNYFAPEQNSTESAGTEINIKIPSR